MSIIQVLLTLSDGTIQLLRTFYSPTSAADAASYVAGYSVPSGATISTQDYTANANDYVEECQAIGMQTLGQIKLVTDGKNLQQSDYNTIFADDNLWMIERLLMQGSLQLAIAALQALTPLPYLGYYSSDDISGVVAFIQASGLV